MYTLRITLAAWLILMFTLVEGNCPANYEERSGKCLLFLSQQTSWENARMSCILQGGSLVSVSTSMDQQILTDYINDRSDASSFRRIWIGLKNSRSDWRWISDNSYIRPQGCYSVTELTNGFISGTTISTSETLTPPTCISECQRQQAKYAGLVRQVNTNRISCRCEQNFRSENLRLVQCTWRCPADNQYYCGADSSTESVFVYRINDVASELDKWSRGQPNNFAPYYQPYQSCMVMMRQTGEWGDENCAEEITSDSVPYSHICEYKWDQNTCSSLFKEYHEGICYSVHEISQLSWFKARENCIVSGGDLITVKSQDFFDHLVQRLNSISGLNSRYWIGGTNDRWLWNDDQPLQAFTYWAARMPEKLEDSCVALNKLSSTNTPWQWEAWNCNEQTAFICEAVSSQRLTPSSTSVMGRTTPTTTTTTTTSRSSSSSSTTASARLTPSLATMSNTLRLTPATSIASPPASESKSIPASTTTISFLRTSMFSFSTVFSSTNVSIGAVAFNETLRTIGIIHPVPGGVIVSIAFVGVVLVVTTVRTLMSCFESADNEDGEESY